MLKRLFILQLIVILAFLSLVLFNIQSQALTVILTAGLVGLWLAGAWLEPASLLLSALALAGIPSTLSVLYINDVPFSVNGLLVAALGVASGLAVAIHYRQQFRTGRQIRRWLIDGAPLFIILPWAVVRTIGAPSLTNAISDILIWVTVACVYTLGRAYWVANPQRIRDGEKALVYTALLPLTGILVDALLGNVFFNNTTTQHSLGLNTTLGVRLIPSLFGLLLVPMLVQLRAVSARQTWHKWVVAGLVAVLSVWVFLSLSRLVLIATAGVVFPMALLWPRSLWKAALVVGLGMAVTVLFITSPVYPRPLFVSLDSIIIEGPAVSPGEEGNGEGLQLNRDALRGLSFGRTGVWEYLIRTALSENLVLGHGTGAARDYVKNAAVNWDNPHSDYVRIFFDLGLIGLAIFVYTWAYKILGLWHTWLRFSPQSDVARRNFTAAIAVGYILVSFATDNFLVYFFMMGPLSLLLAMADAEKMRAEIPAEGTPTESSANPEPAKVQPSG
ncbi:MAG: O-antigen ligase family protein [Anaerolineae bacterium]|nr:O-antigen ligase family protein [Anaerolineae bacterium]